MLTYKAFFKKSQAEMECRIQVQVVWDTAWWRRYLEL